MERRRALLEILREAVRISGGLAETMRELEKEVYRNLLEDVVKTVSDEVVKAFYEIKIQKQPSIEELKAEIAKAMGLENSGDLLEELRRILRSSEVTHSERVRESSSENTRGDKDSG